MIDDRQDRLADVALTDRPARHLQHPLERHSRTIHDLGTELDPRLQVAQGDVELLERVQRHVRAHVAVAIPIPAWDAEYMTQATSITQADAVAQARSFSWIAAGNSRIYTPWITDMKTANPTLKILMYVGATAVGVGKTLPDSYYAHDSAGNRIQLRDWPVYQMEPSSSGWRSYVASRCTSLLTTSGYDGCFFDQLGPAPLNISYVTGIPVIRRSLRWRPRLAWPLLGIQVDPAFRTARSFECLIPIAATVLAAKNSISPASGKRPAHA